MRDKRRSTYDGKNGFRYVLNEKVDGCNILSKCTKDHNHLCVNCAVVQSRLCLRPLTVFVGAGEERMFSEEEDALSSRERSEWSFQQNSPQKSRSNLSVSFAEHTFHNSPLDFIERSASHLSSDVPSFHESDSTFCSSSNLPAPKETGIKKRQAPPVRLTFFDHVKMSAEKRAALRKQKARAQHLEEKSDSSPEVVKVVCPLPEPTKIELRLGNLVMDKNEEISKKAHEMLDLQREISSLKKELRNEKVQLASKKRKERDDGSKTVIIPSISSTASEPEKEAVLPK